jgi:Cu2+-exporting ATPase
MIVKASPSSVPKSSGKLECTHCSLPVPAGLFEPDRVEQFCCGGCEGAYNLIHSSGLGSFYRMLDKDSASKLKPDVTAKRGFAEFDEPVFLKKYAKAINDSESMVELAIEGIHCAACIWLIEKLPSIRTGVTSATANWAKRTVKVRWRTDEVPLSQIGKTLSDLGYPPSPILPNQARNSWKLENRNHLTLIGVAAACAGNNMIISAALYLGMFSHMTIGMAGLLRAASCVVGVLALLWPGRVFLRSAFNAIKTRTPHMDLPIALGLTVGTIAGFANVVRGVGEIYFDSLSVLIFLLLIGRWIQFRQQAKAASAVELLSRLTPQKTLKLFDGEARETLVDLIQVDDFLQIRPGDLFPVDGEVIAGATTADESILTGESQAIDKTIGDSVAAGTINESSMVVVRATGIGQQTRISKIVDLVEQASMDKPEIVQWANKIGGYFVALVILLALGTLGYWMTVDLEVAIDRSIALLIVACPCALALATPLAIAAAIGRAASERIMIKSGDVLQSLQQPGMIWLDKTGTLTEGRLHVERWYGDTSQIDIVAALEQTSSHPVAKAIVGYRESCWTRTDHLKSVQPSTEVQKALAARGRVLASKNIPGKGVQGAVGANCLLIGNKQLILDHGITIARRFERIEQRIIDAGLSPCWIAINNSIAAIVAIGDSLRSDALESVRHLQRSGWQVGILSGDHQQIVDRVAKRLGIPSEQAIGGVDPEQKLATVNASAQHGTVVMVGDGVNDSAALAAATVGIAVKSGAEASLAAAPVYLANAGLNPIIDLLSLCKSTCLTMRINLGVSLTYNVVFAVLAFTGFINPLVAAILMPISSLTVVALSVGAGQRTRTLVSKAGGR